MSGIRLSPDVLYRDLDGQAVILDLSSGRYFGLNQVGTRIWTLIGDGLDTAAIVATLSREFDADVATIERDLRDLLDALSSRRLIVPTDDRHP
jgi:coenzyme PQQ synthesis protein D (PqqD)